MENSPRSSRQLALAALGVVFGDIGTSPLYALRTCLGVSPEMTEPANVLGLLSLIVWALIIVVCIKYLAIILNADNRGEGGVLALSTLVLTGRLPLGRTTLGMMGLLGAALFFADGAITPAISVLSAVEGLEVRWPGASAVVVPATIVILLALFRFQSRGTENIGKIFGPVMTLWFLTLALLGAWHVAHGPTVLFAFNPFYAIAFLDHHGTVGVAVISGVFLAVTGGEALFADLGHFGKGPMRVAWYSMVFPALVLNYLGQGALVLASPDAVRNPFFEMTPGLTLAPLVLLATAATIIASQAAISGVFSVVHQAVRLSFVPRMDVRHFSANTFGQVYVPAANLILGALTLLLVLGFRSSDALAGAYGVAVSGNMAIATILTLVWLRQRDSRMNRWLMGVMAAIFIVDITFVGSNLLKIFHGGWVPLAIAGFIYVIMTTWTKGRVIMANHIAREHRSIRELEARLNGTPAPARAPGTAVFLASNADGVPRALWHNLRYNNVIHERVILITIETEEVPRVTADRRIEITEVLPGVVRLVGRAGFMETPSVTALLHEADKRGLRYNPGETTFFVGNESLFYGRSALSGWEKRLFAFLLRNSRRAASFYGVPDRRLVEFGTRLSV